MPPDCTPLHRVIVVEDDADLREELIFALGESGFSARGVSSASELYRALAVAPCDLLVLDVGLPGEDGYSIAAHLHQAGNIGIVMLTARGAVDDRLRGLQEGADAYLVKPVDFRELVATLQAVARRLGGVVRPAAPAPAPTAVWRLEDNGWALRDPEGRSVVLSAAERSFLRELMANSGTTVSREQLIAAFGVDPYDYDPHRLETLVSRLRRKAADAGITLPLRAVRGSGYVFSATAEAAQG